MSRMKLDLLCESAPIMTFSKTLSPLNKPTPCKVRAIPNFASSSGFGQSIFLPSNETEPFSGSTSPEIALKIVVLPAPFGPIKPTTELGATFK